MSMRLNITENEEFSQFETLISNTGIGIAKERVPFLFKMFGELKHKQSMKHVKDRGIGVGLSCSKILTEALNGQIDLVQVEQGLTSLKVSVPVRTSIANPTPAGAPLSSDVNRHLSSQNLQNMIGSEMYQSL